MIRVLQVVNRMDRAGLETMLMNYYRHLDRSRVQFDFLTHRPDAGDYDGEIRELGGRIYHAPRLYPRNYIAYFACMKRFFAGHPEYRVVHSHIDAMSAFPLAAAKRARIPVRIAHSHNTSMDIDFKLPIKLIAKSRLPELATDFFACSGEAARFLFGEEIYASRRYTVLNNAVAAADFSYDENAREKMRAELDLRERFTIGHIGRFTHAKNQGFLIDIFSELCRMRPDSVLLLIGAGEDEEKIRRKVRRLRLEPNVKFLGVRGDVPVLLQAMDVFVLPSRYEGLPVVCVEAQAAGLPVVASECVPEAARITGLLRRFSLSQPPRRWAETILQSKQNVRCGHEPEFKCAGFDVADEAAWLQEYYLRKWEEVPR